MFSAKYVKWTYLIISEFSQLMSFLKEQIRI